MSARRWAVIGSSGMLGTDLASVLEASGDDVLRFTRADLDIRDPAACLDAVEGVDVVLNAAAWTDVDGAESDESAAFAVNAVGAANLARACNVHGATMVHFSTDYVFDGTGRSPYTVAAPLDPINAYGRTKAAGEWAVRAECRDSFVVRTAWLYGEHGSSFVRTMLRLATERDTVEVVNDQRGQPTWTRDVATYVQELVVSGAQPGLHHGTSSGEATWYDLARETFRLAGLDPDRVRPTTAASYLRPAARPTYSVLANDGRLPDWRESLARAVPALARAATRP
jgi:dTDP-4-dehydrorhamnose reductase